MKIPFPNRRFPAMVKPNQKAADDARKKYDRERYEQIKKLRALRNRSQGKK